MAGREREEETAEGVPAADLQPVRGSLHRLRLLGGVRRAADHEHGQVLPVRKAPARLAGPAGRQAAQEAAAAAVKKIFLPETARACGLCQSSIA